MRGEAKEVEKDKRGEWEQGLPDEAEGVVKTLENVSASWGRRQQHASPPPALVLSGGEGKRATMYVGHAHKSKSHRRAFSSSQTHRQLLSLAQEAHGTQALHALALQLLDGNLALGKANLHIACVVGAESAQHGLKLLQAERAQPGAQLQVAVCGRAAARRGGGRLPPLAEERLGLAGPAVPWGWALSGGAM